MKYSQLVPNDLIDLACALCPWSKNYNPEVLTNTGTTEVYFSSGQFVEFNDENGLINSNGGPFDIAAFMKIANELELIYFKQTQA
ncbi:MAG: hypothetical protein EOO39_00625 [Cytophagaceae bacterium]|nr:MAG: hypothetical protein EOO39_00625 [Cytophagaceae bacterium]